MRGHHLADRLRPLPADVTLMDAWDQRQRSRWLQQRECFPTSVKGSRGARLSTAWRVALRIECPPAGMAIRQL
jgi:hypothetical protein